MNSKQIMDEKALKEGMESVAKRILEDSQNPKNIVLIGILTRGYNLAQRLQEMIARERKLEVKVGALDTSLFRDDMKGEIPKDESRIPFDITGKDVIIVDDVMYTGRTIRAAMDALVSHGRPKSIKTAVLIDRGHRELPITADYVGVLVPTSIKEKVRVKLHEVDGGKDGAYIVSQ